MTQTKLNIKAETPLEKHVLAWINLRASDYSDSGAEGALKDLFHGGCQSGLVGHLIYYHHTLKFYKRHKKEIHSLLRDMFDNTGYKSPQDLFGDKWDTEDPLADDTNNQNLLAWFGFEETARKLADRAGLEI